MSQLRIGIIGMGGYAGAHHRTVYDLEEEGLCRFHVLPLLYRSYFDYLAGKAERPLVSLRDTASFVRLSGLVYAAAGTIHPIDPCFCRAERDGDDRKIEVAGMDKALVCFDADGTFPSEQGLPWGHPGGIAAAADIDRLRAVVEGMLP